MKSHLYVIAIVLLTQLLLWLLPGCSGGGVDIVLGDLSGTWLETYTPTSDPEEMLMDEAGDVVLTAVNATSYTLADADSLPGDVPATLQISGTTFTITNSYNAPMGATAVYEVTINTTGTATATLLTGSGTLTLELASGDDEEGLDGYTATFNYTLAKQAYLST